MRFTLFLFLILTQLLLSDTNVTATKSLTEQIRELIGKDSSHTVETNKRSDMHIKEKNSTVSQRDMLKVKKKKEEQQQLAIHIGTLIEEMQEIDTYLLKDNFWASVYHNHEIYQKLANQLKVSSDNLKSFSSKSLLTKEDKLALEREQENYQVIEGKLSQLKEYKDDPLVSFVTSPEIGEEPTITNPVDIITAMSFQKQIKTVQEEYLTRYETLQDAVGKLYEKRRILRELLVESRGEAYSTYLNELEAIEKKITDFERTLEIFKTSANAFEQKVSQINLNIDKSIEHEIEKSIITGSIILFILLIFFFIKYLVKKYMSDNELFYGTNKVINFLFIILVFTILLFTYLDNVGHLVTVLSFASAGIAIALKDWFMSLMGWVVILVSGSIHVGDRVKFVKDGTEYVGDVVDISVLRMTLHEDVTLTTTSLNRRAGRIIFVPNNYIFTDMMSNYSHSGLKTVWDGIDFLITFDSDIAKAQHISKDVSRKYSKGYTDMTRKQLNRLRSKYSMRNTAVEPRIFAFLDTYGVRISVWYLTNSYATLTLRSTISMEILARLNEEDDISIAFPSQSLYMDKAAPKLKLEENEEPTEEHRVESAVPAPNQEKSEGRKPSGWGAY
jgi:small-conductance mechanosensitive channel